LELLWKKKSQQSETGHFLIQNFLFKTTGNQRLVTKSKNHTPHNTGLSPIHNSNMGFNPKCMVLKSYPTPLYDPPETQFAVVSCYYDYSSADLKKRVAWPVPQELWE